MLFFVFCSLFVSYQLNQRAKARIEEFDAKHILNARREVKAHAQNLPVVDPSSGILITEEMYLSKPFCSEGFWLQEIGVNDKGFYCTDGKLVEGPFTKTMIHQCLQQIHSTKLCLCNYWPLKLALSLRGKQICPAGASFDVQTKYCKEDDFNLGPFSPSLKDECKRSGNVAICDQNKWPRQLVLDLQDKNAVQLRSFDEVISEIKQNKEIYKMPTSEDLERTNMREVTEVSEEVLPPFILAPRRQTDSLVRQVYELLPNHIKEETAFVLADRLVQNPEAYLNYLKGKKSVVIIGSFWGIGDLKSKRDEQYTFILYQHEKQFFKLKASISLVKSLGLEIKDVIYGMGDSYSPLRDAIRDNLQQRYNKILVAAELGHLVRPLSWGVDELVEVAFAKQLPTQRIFLQISNPKALQFMDARKSASTLSRSKIAELGLEETKNKNEADLIAYIFTRKNTKFLDDFEPEDAQQRELDKQFMTRMSKLSVAENKKLVIVDARLFNGAWDSNVLPHTCDYLAYGSWGTFSNNIGATLAQAKILNYTKNENARERMLLEAIYHDVFFNGHETVQRGPAQKLLSKYSIDFSHFNGYETPETTSLVFKLMNEKANKNMQSHFANSKCMNGRSLRATPQYWRTFESEVHLLPIGPNENLITGLYRKDLPPETFDPTYGVRFFD